MYEDSEVVSLVMCVISAGFIGRFANRDIPQFRYFYWGLLLMCASFLATVAEGVLWPDLFNAIEHLCPAISGWLFTIACRNLYQAGSSSPRQAVDLSSGAAAPMNAIWLKAH